MKYIKEMESNRDTQQVAMSPIHPAINLLTKKGMINAGIEIIITGSMTLLINSFDGN